MGKRLFVGNLPWEATEAELQSFIGPDAVGVKIIVDRETGRSRGFGFIEAVDEMAAVRITEEFNGRLFIGRDLRINEAHDRPARSGPGGGYGERAPQFDDKRGGRSKGRGRRRRDDDDSFDRY